MSNKTTIETTDDLLALRGPDGTVRTDGDLIINCSVPWSVGVQVSGLYVRGNLYVGGNLDVRGNLEVGGNLYVRGYLVVRSDLDVGGYLEVGGYLVVGGYLDVRGYLYVRGDYLVIAGDLIWSHAAVPLTPGKVYIRRILPPAWQRDHWQDRLGMDISDGCYDEICKTVRQEIDRLLNDEKWTSTERWMLETLRDSKKEPPTWVADLRKKDEDQ